MNPNILIFHRGSKYRNASEPFNLLEFLLKERQYELAEISLTNPMLTVDMAYEKLAWINKEYESVDRIRETLLNRVRPQNPLKRSRYDPTE